MKRGLLAALAVAIGIAGIAYFAWPAFHRAPPSPPPKTAPVQSSAVAESSESDSLSQPPAEAAAEERMFSRFKVKVYTGPTHPPEFVGPQRQYHRFRTRIREGIQAGPNFAGHYAFIEIGCGTECSWAVIADVKTGKLYDFPPDGAPYSARESAYRPDSSVLDVGWETGQAADARSVEPTYCHSAWVKWNGVTFRPFDETKTPGEC
jgi:hypothetical protein